MKTFAYDYGDEYAFGEDIDYIIKPIEHKIFPKGNQGKNDKTKSACTIVGAVNQLIRLFGIDLDMEQTNKLYINAVDYCVSKGYKVGEGRSTPTACNNVCKWWNEIAYKTFNKEKVFRLRLYWSNDRIIEALDKGHLVGFTKNVSFSSDQVEGLVYHEPSMYPKMVGHRLNWSGVKYIKATGGADISKAERGAEDNYHGQIGEFFAFLEMKPYINRGVYAYGYLILPVSRMKSNIEKEKERISKLKAVNTLIGTLSSTYQDLDTDSQLMMSALATSLRDKYEGRPLIEDKNKKVLQGLVDYLSYSWKYGDEEAQKRMSELADYLRKNYGLE